MIRTISLPWIQFTLVGIFLIGMNSCSSTNSKEVSYEYAVYENEPVFEDEYLFPTTIKKGKAKMLDDVEVSLIDWNDNGVYGEIDTDYLGIKTHLNNKPTLQKLKSKNIININGVSYEIIIDEDNYSLAQTSHTDSDINVITKYVAINLSDGSTLNLELEDEKTVIYFWATWCGPCVKTLKGLADKMGQLKADGIRFIPIAYDCSDYASFIEKHNLPYEAIAADKEVGKMYGIFNLPVQYTFDRAGNLAKQNLNLKNYYNHNYSEETE